MTSAGLLQDKGDYAAAEALYRETLELKRSLLGERHEDVARGMHNLASLLHRWGRYGRRRAALPEGLGPAP